MTTTTTALVWPCKYFATGDGKPSGRRRPKRQANEEKYEQVVLEAMSQADTGEPNVGFVVFVHKRLAEVQ